MRIDETNAAEPGRLGQAVAQKVRKPDVVEIVKDVVVGRVILRPAQHFPAGVPFVSPADRRDSRF